MPTPQELVEARKQARLAKLNPAITPTIQPSREEKNALSASPRRNLAPPPPVDPTRGVRGTGTLETFQAKPTNFETLEDAQIAAEDERIRDGSVSASTEAAIFRGTQDINFLNDEAGFIAKRDAPQAGTSAARALQGQDPFANRFVDPKSPDFIAPKADQRRPIASERTNQQITDLTGKSVDQRAIDAGIESSDLDLARFLTSQGITDLNQLSHGTSDGRIVLNDISPELAAKLKAAGLVSSETPTGDRNSKNTNLVLKAGSSFAKNFMAYSEISSGQDIRKAVADNQAALREEFTVDAGRKIDRTGQDSRAAMDTASARTKRPAKVETPDVVKLGSLASKLDGVIAATGDPLGPIIKEMMLEEEQNKLNTEANAKLSLDASITGAETADTEQQDFLDKYVKLHTQENDKLTKILNQTRDSTEKYLTEQKERDTARLTWEQDSQTRKLEKQKTDQLLSQSIQNALSGGAFSGAANEQLASTEREWDLGIADLGKEFAFKKADVSAFYTQKYVETQNQFRMDIFTAAKALNSTIEGYATAGFNSIQAKKTAIVEANNAYRTTIDTAAKDYNTSLKGYVKDMQTSIKENRIEKSQKEVALWDRLFKQRAQDGNLNPELTKKILQDMGEAGIDVSGIDANAMTVDQANEVYRRSVEQQKSSGKLPLSQQIIKIAEADNAFKLLDRAEEAISKYKSVGGPITGMSGIGDTDPSFLARAGKLGADVVTGLDITGIAGNALERQREAVATFNLVKQVIGKAMEGGVLRREDELKYERLLPTLRDTNRIRTYKVNQLRSAMEDGKRTLLNSMSNGGYNTSGYESDSRGNNFDPIQGNEDTPHTNDDADEILRKIESGEPLSSGTPTGFMSALASAHARHEGYLRDPNAVTITKGNNPGALKYHTSNAKFGSTPGKNNFAMFPDVDSGYRALVADLHAKITGGSAHIDYSKNPTLLSYIKIYAPETDGNNPSAYAKDVIKTLKRFGYDVNLDTPLSEISYLLG